MFRAIVADPPWLFSDQGSRLTPKYGLMSNADIAALDVPSAEDALLFLWCPAALLESAGFPTMRAWGFEPKTAIVWLKTAGATAELPPEEMIPRIGGGHYVRNAHESCWIGAKGAASRLIQDHGVPSWFAAPRGAHSAKPEKLQDMVERLIAGPYLEMFARRVRPGWTCLGNEIEGGGSVASIGA